MLPCRRGLLNTQLIHLNYTKKSRVPKSISNPHFFQQRAFSSSGVIAMSLGGAYILTGKAIRDPVIVNMGKFLIVFGIFIRYS